LGETSQRQVGRAKQKHLEKFSSQPSLLLF